MIAKEIFTNTKKYMGKKVTLEGWIKNHRKQKEFGFISFSDGTFFTPIQIIYEKDLKDFETIQKYHIGSSIKVEGTVVESPKENQAFEIKATNIELLGDCPEDYPIQPKKHSREFLREQAYLRPRTNLFQAVFRIRSKAAFAIHEYFQERDFIYFHAPLITGSDCEGAGEMFKVTTFDLDKIPHDENGNIDYSKDFFAKQASLTVSGQLQAETFALAYKNTYTFGPTFRAENSNTKTHANEFWMIEPEMAFYDLEEDMNIMEGMLKYIVKYVLDNCREELDFLDNFVEKGLVKKLEDLVAKEAIRITHHDAIKYLLESGKKFEFEPQYGEDLAREHEKYLTEEKFNAPVFVYDWPKDIKAFYMRLNDDKKTVAAVDLLVPGSGELMGGSQREERYDILEKRMKEMNVSTEELSWYLNLRKYGGCVHSGFGMGFERLIMYLTGIENIRDVIPYPRTPGNCEF
ncbi:MAG: asparagine--tRNA ligase [Bacilli bacterium]|nr:asparagine--tRNA ligase [Bacilli bacterium]